MKTNNSKRDKEIQERYDQLLKESKGSKEFLKECQSISLKEVRELGISTEPTMVISFNEDEK
tara:strand:+ start:359 stop:544 length:186 start_codon:yes stop_codon:yes gene_type:complete